MEEICEYIDKASNCIKDDNEVFICLYAKTDSAQNCLSYNGNKMDILASYMTLGAALCEKLGLSYDTLTDIMKESVESVDKIMKEVNNE